MNSHNREATSYIGFHKSSQGSSQAGDKQRYAALSSARAPYASTSTCSEPRLHANTHMYIYIYISMHICTYVHAYIYIYMYEYALTPCRIDITNSTYVVSSHILGTCTRRLAGTAGRGFTLWRALGSFQKSRVLVHTPSSRTLTVRTAPIHSNSHFCQEVLVLGRGVLVPRPRPTMEIVEGTIYNS